MATVKVLDSPQPVGLLCWKQNLDAPRAMQRCDRADGHRGLHSWESANMIDQLRKERNELAAKHK